MWGRALPVAARKTTRSIWLDSWLADCRPPLCVYLAHGESYWIHDLLVVSRYADDLLHFGYRYAAR